MLDTSVQSVLDLVTRLGDNPEVGHNILHDYLPYIVGSSRKQTEIMEEVLEGDCPLDIVVASYLESNRDYYIESILSEKLMLHMIDNKDNSCEIYHGFELLDLMGIESPYYFLALALYYPHTGFSVVTTVGDMDPQLFRPSPSSRTITEIMPQFIAKYDWDKVQGLLYALASENDPRLSRLVMEATSFYDNPKAKEIVYTALVEPGLDGDVKLALKKLIIDGDDTALCELADDIPF
ncbi:MAG: hypothetical protein KJ601_07355 [Nanoarchaeota archaeon]|nr:hypothetical protein [Nanoarchaeota archaeon]